MLYTGHAKYEEGRESNHHTYPLYFLNHLSFYFLQAMRFTFIKSFSKTQSECKSTSLNNANNTLTRSLWIRTYSRHLECELLLDDRLVHLPECSHRHILNLTITAFQFYCSENLSEVKSV